MRRFVTEQRNRTPETVQRLLGSRARKEAFDELSKDYQILCNLTHENLEACGQTIEELRRRLTGNIHYTVLAKLDEVHALVEAHLAGK